MSSLDIPEDIEVSGISSDLNSVILLVFFTGMYTVIYFGTIYFYFKKNPSKYHLVPAAITLLFLSSIAQAIIQWYALKWDFVNNGATRQSIFLAIYGNPRWVDIALNVSNSFCYAIADGLLIWRCFHVWNHSFRIILLPLLLLIAEFALIWVEISFNARYTNLSISTALAAKLNAFLAAAMFLSFGTTLVTTGLIAYRIISVSKHQGPSHRRFKHIVDIVVQSGAVYAVSQLVAAISDVVPGANTIDSRAVVAFQDYTQGLNFAIAGISSTVMVARVAMLSADTTYPSTSVYLSGLQFHARSTHPTVHEEAMEITHSVDGNQGSAGKEHVAEAKVQ